MTKKNFEDRMNRITYNRDYSLVFEGNRIQVDATNEWWLGEIDFTIKQYKILFHGLVVKKDSGLYYLEKDFSPEF